MAHDQPFLDRLNTLPTPVADVSILAANYNNGPFLAAFLDSICQSSMLPKELILVDDGSTDSSMEIVQMYRHLPFLHVILFPQNRGFTTALNAGLEAATGKYIMRADPDDLITPDRIEKQYSFLENHPDIAVLGCNCSYFQTGTGAVINQSNFPLSHAGIIKAYQRGEHGIQHPTAIVRAEVFKQYRYQPIYPGEDYALFAQMVADGWTFANLPDPLYWQRVHQASSTSNLQYAAIRQTFVFRDQIFNQRTPSWWIWLYYHHIRYYRQAQLSTSLLAKYGYLTLSALLYPQKLLKRLER